MDYKSIVFIGSGSLLTNCLRVAAVSAVGQITCIESETKEFSNLATVCTSLGVKYLSLTNRNEIAAFFQQVAEKTLVLSIHNNHIFSKASLSNENLRVVNFHNSLLPKHPGRNAPSWAIYEMDEKAGITWHEVVPEIDRGAIICQKEVAIEQTHTGIILTRLCVNLGLQSFQEIFPVLLNGSYSAVLQQPSAGSKMHYSYETPNDGVFDTNWPVKKMSAFLRSLDYGIYPIFPKAKVFLQNEWHTIEKYKLAPFGESSAKRDDTLVFEEGGLHIQLYIQPLHKVLTHG